MKEKLIELLESLNYPVFLQGSLASAEAYPDSFFTFWNFESPESQHYDNAANRCVWGFWVYFYSVDPELVAEVPEQARQLLKQNDFYSGSKPVDANVDTPTHTGAFFTCFGVENYEEEETP